MPAASQIDFTGAFKPNVLRVGEKLVIELGIENKSDRDIEGIRIGTSGAWDKYTVVNVLPAGRFESGLLQYNIHSGLTIPPGQRRFVNVVAYPNEPGNHEFTFIPHEGTRQLVGDDGKGIVIGGKVSVIR